MLTTVVSKTPILNRMNSFTCECKKILIVDDENFNIQTLKFILKNFKIVPDFCYNGQEALDKVTFNINKTCCSIQYKVIFMDVMMPIMDGIEACGKLQDLHDRKKIKDINVIMISAHDVEEIHRRVNGIKIVKEFASKPVKKSKIEEFLNKYYFDMKL